MTRGMDAMTLLDWARRIAASGPVCDDCLGMAFGELGRGWTNAERGAALRTVLALSGVEVAPGRCWVCEGLFDRVDEWADRAVEACAGVEFETYLFGLIPTPRLVESEAHFGERFPTGAMESLKHGFNRSVGMAFEARVGSGTVDFQRPHLRFTVDLSTDSLELGTASLYVYGRYRKLERGIPQTHWPCRRCRGTGCESCGGTGKQYSESVEELIGAPFIDAAGAVGVHLHGAGREDIDARMLGTGRPFVLEVLSPRKRHLHLEELRQAAQAGSDGRVELSPLRWADAALVAAIKEAHATKRYRAVVAFDGEVAEEALVEALRGLVGKIEQRTPRRVVHRRADRIRGRSLHEAAGKLLDSRSAAIEFLADGGLYIKELVSGDEGRTRPSLSETIGAPARVVELDVMEVTSEVFPDHEAAVMESRAELPYSRQDGT
jgi:tRNA pseudouridine synthase 10